MIELGEDAREAVTEIFNHYVKHSFAAFFEKPVDNGFFDALMRMRKGYPAVSVKDSQGGIIGFGLLRSHSAMPTMRRAADISVFLHPDFTGMGIGGAVVEHLVEKGGELGIDSILAAISSLNPGSIRFHGRHGFSECGRFVRIGRKFGRDFDLVWMQRFL